MGTSTEKLEYLLGTKSAIREAISEKGISLPGSTAFRDYAEKITEIQTAENKPPDPGLVYRDTRPADWLDMPVPQDDEIYLLFHIPSGASSLIAFTVACTGEYTVALGTVTDKAFLPGSSVNLESGAKYEAELSAGDFPSTPTSEGMSQVMIRITGAGIQSWVCSPHSKKTSPAGFSDWNIMEISCRLPGAEKVTCGSSVPGSALTRLRYFSWTGENAAKDMTEAFRGCAALTAVLQLDTSRVRKTVKLFRDCFSLTAIPALSTSGVTDMNGMFEGCRSLTAVPALDTSGVKDTNAMFQDCRSLTAVPALDTSGVTNMSYFARGCSSLRDFPALDTSSVTNMDNMLRECDSLVSVPLLNTSHVAIMQSMFEGCHSLSAIPQLDTSSVSKMKSMFQDCTALVSVSGLSTSQATEMISLFQGCTSLVLVRQLDISKVADMTSAFGGCSSLASLTFHDGNVSAEAALSLQDCSLGHAALHALFVSLPIRTAAKQLTLTGNPGVPELTAEDQEILIAKNWTVVL